MENGGEAHDQNPVPASGHPSANPSVLPAPQTNSRRAKWFIGFILSAALLAAWIYNIQSHQSAPQFVTFPNGQVYQFAGTTYSRQVIAPNFESHLVSLLPKPLADFARKKFGDKVAVANADSASDRPRLILWFKSTTTYNPASTPVFPYIVKLTDEDGIEAGVGGVISQGSAIWTYAPFDAVSRRSRTLVCGFCEFPKSRPYSSAITALTITNPLYAKYPQWKPEPMPATKLAGDVVVQLEFARQASAMNGVDSLYYAAEPYTLFNVHIQPPRGSNERWIPTRSVVSDATGNALTQIQSYDPNFGFEGGWLPLAQPGLLWPSESTWKVHLEIKRTRGFAPDELVTFTDVPVPGSSSVKFQPITVFAHGVRLILTNRIFNWGLYSEKWLGFPNQVRIELADKHEGVVADIVQVKATGGRDLSYNTWPDGFLRIDADSRAVTNIEVTCAIQKMRSVDFFVKPPSPVVNH